MDEKPFYGLEPIQEEPLETTYTAIPKKAQEIVKEEEEGKNEAQSLLIGINELKVNEKEYTKRGTAQNSERENSVNS